MKPRRKNTPFPLLSFALAMLMLLGAAGCGQDPVDACFAGLAEGTDGASPRDIRGLWMIDGAAWAVTASSLARCGDGRSVDFPTYMVQWSPGQRRFYYVQQRTLFSYDPAAEETAEVCKIHRDAHVLAAVTDHYAIAAQERGTACFQVNLDTLEVLPFTVVLETPLDHREDKLLYNADNCLLEYDCAENKSVCLYAPAEEDTRLVSACYDDGGNVLFVYRRGEYRERGTPCTTGTGRRAKPSRWRRLPTRLPSARREKPSCARARCGTMKITGSCTFTGSPRRANGPRFLSRRPSPTRPSPTSAGSR